jgi:hypothetical protein
MLGQHQPHESERRPASVEIPARRDPGYAADALADPDRSVELDRSRELVGGRPKEVVDLDVGEWVRALGAREVAVGQGIERRRGGAGLAERVAGRSARPSVKVSRRHGHSVGTSWKNVEHHGSP